MEAIFRSDLLWMCRVRNVITSTFPFAFCNGSTSRKHVSTDLSLSSSRIEIWRKLLFGCPETNSFFNFIDESSVDCNPFFPGSKILKFYPTDFFSAPIAEFIMYIVVRPCKMVLVNKFRETCFASVTNVSLLDISFFCVLFNVSRLSSCKSGKKLETSTHVLAHERCAYSASKSVSRCAGKYGWTLATQRIGG